MKDHYKEIYSNRAEDYHKMIAVEDADGNILKSLLEITPFEGKVVLDLGSGTGRIPLLVGSLAQTIVGLDLHRGMLVEQFERQPANLLTQGDMRCLPLVENKVDLVTAGWALGHFPGWFGAAWQTQARMVVHEMERACKPGGWIILLETMGTGTDQAGPPSESLTAYYEWLKDEWGFQSKVISTDYQFTNLEEAVHYSEFFFGKDLADKVKVKNWVRLPEWTGVWWKQIQV